MALSSDSIELNVVPSREPNSSYTSQTVCSFNLRMAIKTLCARILWSGTPTVEQLRPVLESANLERLSLLGSHKKDTVEISLAEVIVEYEQSRSYAQVANKFNIWRPE
jgi:hypothetical protein